MDGGKQIYSQKIFAYSKKSMPIWNDWRISDAKKRKQYNWQIMKILYSKLLKKRLFATRQCQWQFNKNTEGLYLTKAETFEPRSYKLNINKTQITNDYLTLALIDNNAYKRIENYRELNVRNCYSLLNHLNLVRQTVKEQFYRLNDFPERILFNIHQVISFFYQTT